MSAGDPLIQLKSHSTQIVELLLKSIYWTVQDGRIHSFLYGRPDRIGKNMGVEIQYSGHALLKAALYVRENAPKHMRDLPIAEIEKRLTHFVSDNFWILSREVFGATFACSFGEFVSLPTKIAFASLLSGSDVFVAPELLSVYPLVPLRVTAAFDGGLFFLIPPLDLAARAPTGRHMDQLEPGQFPPYKDHKGTKHLPASWLGVRAPTDHASRKIKAAVLGSLALTAHPLERFLYTGRKVFGGQCTIASDQISFGFGESHTPALSEDIVLVASDHSWLSILSQKLTSDDPTDKRHTKALEYFYRAWKAAGAIERFPTLFMALDALYGERNKTTRTITAGVVGVMSTSFGEKRVRHLLSLRGAVIHGGAPDVCESDEYHAYFVDYGNNPIADLDLVAARCLQAAIFDGKLIERPHTYADLIRQKTGRTV